MIGAQTKTDMRGRAISLSEIASARSRTARVPVTDASVADQSNSFCFRESRIPSVLRKTRERAFRLRIIARRDRSPDNFVPPIVTRELFADYEILARGTVALINSKARFPSGLFVDRDTTFVFRFSPP